jgi:hypothetical protein
VFEQAKAECYAVDHEHIYRYILQQLLKIQHLEFEVLFRNGVEFQLKRA